MACQQLRGRGILEQESRRARLEKASAAMSGSSFTVKMITFTAASSA